jgi:uncharacterized membrane protein HdeD (DUF308 family)
MPPVRRRPPAEAVREGTPLKPRVQSRYNGPDASRPRREAWRVPWLHSNGGESTVTAIETRAPATTPWWLVLIQGVAAALLGLLLLTNPAATTVILVQFLGIWWLVGGILSVVAIFIDRTNWPLRAFSGVLGIVAGILVLNHPLWSALLIPTTLVVLLGVLGVLIGIIYLLQAFQGEGWGIGLLGILSVALGLYLAFNPLGATLALPIVIGALAVVGGIAAVVLAFRLR